MTSRTARAHPQPYRGPKSSHSDAVKWRKMSQVVCRGFVTHLMIEPSQIYGAIIRLKTNTTGEFYVGMPPAVFRRIANTLRSPFEYYPAGEYGFADAQRVMKFLRGRWIKVRWYHMHRPGEDRWTGDMIETIQEEENG